MGEGEFKKHAITQYDMRAKLSKIAKDMGYVHDDGTIHPTKENISAQINYEYKALFVPIEVVDSAKKDIFKGIKRNPVLYVHNDWEYDPDKIPELLDKLEKWFGDSS